MSAKQIALLLIEQLPDNVTLGAITQALQEAHATEEALHRFDERGDIPDEDVTDEEWLALITRSWADDLNGPRQDIYTADDGKPLDESRSPVAPKTTPITESDPR